MECLLVISGGVLVGASGVFFYAFLRVCFECDFDDDF